MTLPPNKPNAADGVNKLANRASLSAASDWERYPAYVKHNETTLEWAEMSSKPILFDCEHIVDSGFGWLILMEK
jgi:hypothetical protein